MLRCWYGARHRVVPSGEIITCSFGGRLDFDQFGLYRSIHKFSLFLYVSEKRFAIYTRILFLAYVVNIEVITDKLYMLNNK